MEPCRSHRAIRVRRSGRDASEPCLEIRRSFRSRPRRPHLLQTSSTISSGYSKGGKPPFGSRPFVREDATARSRRREGGETAPRRGRARGVRLG